MCVMLYSVLESDKPIIPQITTINVVIGKPVLIPEIIAIDNSEKIYETSTKVIIVNECMKR